MHCGILANMPYIYCFDINIIKESEQSDNSSVGLTVYVIRLTRPRRHLEALHVETICIIDEMNIRAASPSNANHVYCK